jgi:hypothetical protein
LHRVLDKQKTLVTNVPGSYDEEEDREDVTPVVSKFQPDNGDSSLERLGLGGIKATIEDILFLWDMDVETFYALTGATIRAGYNSAWKYIIEQPIPWANWRRDMEKKSGKSFSAENLEANIDRFITEAENLEEKLSKIRQAVCEASQSH